MRCCCVPQNVLGVIRLEDRPLPFETRRHGRRAFSPAYPSEAPRTDPGEVHTLRVDRYACPVNFVKAGLQDASTPPAAVVFTYWRELAVRSDDRTLDELARIPGFRRIWWMREVEAKSSDYSPR